MRVGPSWAAGSWTAPAGGGPFINLPVAALAVGYALYAVPETRDPHAAQALDVVGAGLAVISLGRGRRGR